MQAARMKVGVIGTINKDLILPFNDPPIESFGGIVYDIAVLAELLDKQSVITPVSYVGSDMYDALLSYCERRQNVSSAGLAFIEERNHHVILEYLTPEEREERSLFPFPPLQQEQVLPLLDADFVVVNLISGWDLDVESFSFLSKHLRERLYLDVHYLLMGRTADGKRFRQKPEGVDRWIQGAKFIQMNKQEMAVLTGGEGEPPDFYREYMLPDQVLLATIGAEGCWVVYSDAAGEMIQQRLPGYKVPHLIDTTGCGDTFGAAFSVWYLQSGNVEEAVDFANRAAGAKTTLRGTNEMNRLQAVMKQLAEHPSNRGKVRAQV